MKKIEKDIEYDKRYREFLEGARILRKKFIQFAKEKKMGKKTSLIIDFMNGTLENKLEQIEYYEKKKKE